MFLQKVIIDGDPFIMTLPRMQEHMDFLALLREKFPDAFLKNRFHSMVLHDDDDEFLLYCTAQQSMQYSGAIYKMASDEEYRVVDEWSGIGLTVFPKLIPLNRLDKPYRLDPKDYPEGTITSGGTPHLDQPPLHTDYPYSHIDWSTSGPDANWGDHFLLNDKQVVHGKLSWIVMGGCLIAVTAAWRCTPKDLLAAFPWDYCGETLQFAKKAK